MGYVVRGTHSNNQVSVLLCLIGLCTPALNGITFPWLPFQGPKIHDFSPNSGVIFLALIFGTIHILYHQRRGSGEEVEKLIYASVLKSETHYLLMSNSN